MPPTNEKWCAVLDLENMKAQLHGVEDHRFVIRTHALRQSGNWTQVFYEAEMMRIKIRSLEESMTECWEKLYHLAMHNGLPRGDES